MMTAASTITRPVKDTKQPPQSTDSASSTLPIHNLHLDTTLAKHHQDSSNDKNGAMNEDEDTPGVNKDYTQEAPLTQEEEEKLESAATVIQSVYRGYQARRELYGPALTASQKWRHLIDYSRIEYIHKMDAKDRTASSSPLTPEDPNQRLPSSPQAPNENKTRWAWRRAEFLGSRLGKNATSTMLSESYCRFISTSSEATTSSTTTTDVSISETNHGSSGIATEEALVLLTEHWLEMSDKKHRYGSNLKPYHEHWLKQETSQNFFYWLDKGEGKELDLEERPRTRLEEQRVHYLTEHERAHYAVEVVDGLFYYKVSGKPVHTLPTSIQAGDDIDVSQVLPDSNDNDDEATRLEKKRIRNKSKFIYVTDPKGTLYVAQKVKGQFHHSSFLGGGTVCAAGGIIVNHGRLIKINPKSGHYRPGQRHFDRLLTNLKEMGISMEDVKISHGILDSEGAAGATGEGKEGSADRVIPLEKKNVVESEHKVTVS